MADNDGDKVALGVILIFIVLAISTALCGLVIRSYWGWFVVPLGVPSIGLIQAIGLGVLGRLMTIHTKPPATQAEREAMFSGMLGNLVALLVVWGLGLILFKIGG